MSAALATRAALASVATALFLMAIKGWAALATGSVAMLGSLADTALDLLASLITLAGVRIAATPADAEHRFGHGKAEALAALAQVAFIAVSATMILVRAAAAWLAGETATSAEYGIGVSIAAIAATFALLAYQRQVIARTGSVAIAADHVHYQSDLLLNGAVIAALVLDQHLGLRGADPLFGIAIALWLFWGAFRASQAAIAQLMDREWPEEKRRRFVECAAQIPELKSLHDLRTRSSGAQDFVQFHIAMDGHMSVADSHRIVDALEKRLEAEFPGADVIIHVDPEGQVDQPGNPLAEADELARLREQQP